MMSIIWAYDVPRENPEITVLTSPIQAQSTPTAILQFFGDITIIVVLSSA
jgi:hypothetical protein